MEQNPNEGKYCDSFTADDDYPDHSFFRDSNCSATTNEVKNTISADRLYNDESGEIYDDGIDPYDLEGFVSTNAHDYYSLEPETHTSVLTVNLGEGLVVQENQSKTKLSSSLSENGTKQITRPVDNAQREIRKDGKTNLLCDLCKKENEQSVSTAVSFCLICNEYLCNDCFKAHRNSKSSKKHDFAQGDEMPDSHFDFLEYRCPKHKEEDVEYFCLDHDELFCLVCRTYNRHERCSYKNLDDTSLPSDYLEKTFEIVEKLKSDLEESSVYKRMTGSSYRFEKENELIDGIRLKANAFLDNIEKRINESSFNESCRYENNTVLFEILREIKRWVQQKNLLEQSNRIRQNVLFSKYLTLKVAEYQAMITNIEKNAALERSVLIEDIFIPNIMESLENFLTILDNRLNDEVDYHLIISPSNQ